MISLNSKLSKNQGQLSSKIDGKIVLMSTESGKYLALDEIGTDIWERIDNLPMMSDLCDALARDYSADLEVIRADVLKMVSILEDNHLIVVDSQS